MKYFLSFLFILMAPFLLGGILPILALKAFGEPSGDLILVCFFVYTVVYFIIWGGPLDAGRKLKL